MSRYQYNTRMVGLATKLLERLITKFRKFLKKGLDKKSRSVIIDTDPLGGGREA